MKERKNNNSLPTALQQVNKFFLQNVAKWDDRYLFIFLDNLKVQMTPKIIKNIWISYDGSSVIRLMDIIQD